MISLKGYCVEADNRSHVMLGKAENFRLWSHGLAEEIDQRFFSRDCGIRMTILLNTA